MNSLEDGADIFGGRIVVPVRSARNDEVLANIGTTESKAVGIEGTVRLQNLNDELGNALVITNVAARLTSDIALELVKSAAELLENNDLCFDIANLLQYDPGESNIIRIRLINEHIDSLTSWKIPG